MTRYYSYSQQVLHYFDRPHEQPARVPLTTRSAWHGPQIARDGGWRTELRVDQVAELEAALDQAMATGKAVAELTAADFPLPTLEGEVRGWADVVHDGLGFHVVSGVPVERWSPELAERFFWCIGLHMGLPGTQNVHGDLLGHVTDTGDAADDPFVRLYRTSANIAYHCDAADIVGLLCLRPARRGGASRIVSSVSVYNELLTRRPDLAARLYEPFLLDIRNEDSSDELRYVPVPPCRHAGGRLRTFYHSDYFRSVVRHDDVADLGDEERELLDVYEQIAADPALYLDMDLQHGDIQWLSNHTVLHARTRYQDWPEPQRKRHLLRLWLSIGAD